MQKPVKKKIISFDLDGTLVHGRYGDIVWNVGIPEEYAATYGMSVEDAKLLIRGQYQAVGDANLLWYNIDHWLTRFGLTITARELVDRYETSIELCPNTKEVLGSLKNRYTLIIASNAARIFVEKEIAFTGIAGYFSKVMSATTDYGLVKKEHAFYEKICLEMSVRPEEVAHVGDHPVYDHDVPQALGMDAFFIGTAAEWTAPERERKTIYDLKELLNHL